MSEPRPILLHPKDKTQRLYYSPKLMPTYPDVEEMAVWVPKELSDEQVTLEIYLGHLKRQLIENLEEQMSKSNRPQRVLENKVQQAEDNLTGISQAWDWQENQDEKDLVRTILLSPEGYKVQEIWQERLDGVRESEPEDLSYVENNELIGMAERHIEGLIFMLAERGAALMQGR